MRAFVHDRELALWIEATEHGCQPFERGHLLASRMEFTKRLDKACDPSNFLVNVRRSCRDLCEPERKGSRVFLDELQCSWIVCSVVPSNPGSPSQDRKRLWNAQRSETRMQSLCKLQI